MQIKKQIYKSIDEGMKSITENIGSHDNVIVVSYADWCPFCRSFLKVVEENKARLKHELAFENISDESNPLWEKHKIKVVPTLIAFSKWEPVGRMDGVLGVGLGEEDLLKFDKALGKTKLRC